MKLPERPYTWQEHLLYGSIWLSIIVAAIPVLIFGAAWIAKAILWYSELWAILPWPTFK